MYFILGPSWVPVCEQNRGIRGPDRRLLLSPGPESEADPSPGTGPAAHPTDPALWLHGLITGTWTPGAHLLASCPAWTQHSIEKGAAPSLSLVPWSLHGQCRQAGAHRLDHDQTWELETWLQVEQETSREEDGLALSQGPNAPREPQFHYFLFKQLC